MIEKSVIYQKNYIAVFLSTPKERSRIIKFIMVIISFWESVWLVSFIFIQPILLHHSNMIFFIYWANLLLNNIIMEYSYIFYLFILILI